MEATWSTTACQSVLLTSLTVCLLLVPNPTLTLDIYVDPEVVIENGTTGILRCTFKSSEVISTKTAVSWSFQSSQPDTPFSKSPYGIFYFSNGNGFIGPPEFEGRIKFIGDINKKDASIQLSQAQFTDNGTYSCDVKNPPDIVATPGRTELRVVLKESLPQYNTAVIIGGVAGAVLLLVLIALAVFVVIRVLHSRHDYEGCTSLESVSSHAPQPRKKEPSLESSRCSSPSGPLQGPVIYAQLDHSGSKNSFHKMEPVVYADLRKN